MNSMDWQCYNCINAHASISHGINEIIENNNYQKEVADVILNLYDYMIKNRWFGACHAISAVLYVALKEMGYNVVTKTGECKLNGELPFDHSWVEIDGKKIDLAIFMPLNRKIGKYGGPNICDIDVLSMIPHNVLYGINTGLSLHGNTKLVINISLAEYMSNYPNEQNGLWTVLMKIYPYKNKLNIDKLRLKYNSVFRNVVR